MQNQTGPVHWELAPQRSSNFEITKKGRSVTGSPFPCHPNFCQCWGGLNPPGASRPQSLRHPPARSVPVTWSIRHSGIPCALSVGLCLSSCHLGFTCLSFLFHFFMMTLLLSPRGGVPLDASPLAPLTLLTPSCRAEWWCGG